MHVSADGRLLPLGPRSAPALAGRLRSLRARATSSPHGAAILSPLDITPPASPLHLRSGHGPCTEFYGWSLLYQGSWAGVGLIDPHEQLTELPAFYESPQELLDRAEFLAAKGVPSRAVALVTEEADFVVDGAGRRHNRFFPQAIFCQPQGLGWLEAPDRQP